MSVAFVERRRFLQQCAAGSAAIALGTFTSAETQAADNRFGRWPMADRIAGPHQGPYVRSSHGGTQPRARNKDGTWRAKRSSSC